jgi:hypothetical protein
MKIHKIVGIILKKNKMPILLKLTLITFSWITVSMIKGIVIKGWLNTEITLATIFMKNTFLRRLTESGKQSMNNN